MICRRPYCDRPVTEPDLTRPGSGEYCAEHLQAIEERRRWVIDNPEPMAGSINRRIAARRRHLIAWSQTEPDWRPR